MVGQLDTVIEYCKGVGPVKAELLRKELNIFTFGDLLFFYPFRYVDRTNFFTVKEINFETSYIQLKGVVNKTSVIGKGRSARFVAAFSDKSGEIELVWFQGIKWIKEKVIAGNSYVVFGKPNYFNNKWNITHPEIEPEEKYLAEGASVGLFPVYSSTEKLKSKGLDSRGIGKIVKNLTRELTGNIQENLPLSILKKYRFIDRETALIGIHFPENDKKLFQAQRRLKFEELFYIQLRLLMLKVNRNKNLKGCLCSRVGDLFNSFYHNSLPFSLTEAQKNVIRQIRKDMGSGKQMNRLLQGDVGSGKTIVALMCMLIALDNGYQACLMAPTEILAIQHYQTLSKFLARLNISFSLLTGSVKSKDRKLILEQLSNGSLQILIGTHALIEDTVVFNNLGLAVIDEQHRFGVAQRAKLWKKGEVYPHILVMTATPIPRTLAMTLYGDLDVSVIDELPKGRKSIKTLHFEDSDRLRVWGFVREQIKKGRQVYIVYPLIHESETLDLKHLMEGYDAIVRDFPLPDYAVSMVHGQMKTSEKDFEMSRFIKGETQIMVATTVIEVGVDVPNASVMIIENAERFGLTQLHQLRGRVGRGAEQSYCILMTSGKFSPDAKVRIETMLASNDGFFIAETDMKLRGPGNIEGTEQSGIPELKLADLLKDESILIAARESAMNLLETDPILTLPENKVIKNYIIIENKRKGNWSLIS